MSIYLPGMLILVFAITAAAEEACEAQLPVTPQQYVQVEDDGYRPLIAEDIGDGVETSVTGQETGQSWRPQQQSRDCKKQTSLHKADERGYRPLEYDGRSGKPSSRQAQPRTYPPAYPYYWPPQGGNTAPYPYYQRNIGPGSENPYYTEPRMLPGYGVMPYSFGGNGSVP